RFLNWLVSGNEDVPLSFATATNNAGMITSAAASPAFRPADMPPLTGATAQSDLQANSHPWRLLVGARSSDEVSGYVAAPLMELAAPTSAVPGLSSSGSTPTTIGRYAWWIGDEGVKARVNLA